MVVRQVWMTKQQQRLTTVSHQLSSHHIQRLLGGIPADAVTVAGKNFLYDVSSFFSRQSVKHQSHWLFMCSASRSRHAGYPNSKCRAASFANSFCKCDCHFAAYSTMVFNQRCGDICKPGFQIVGIDNDATHEVTRAAADGSDPLCKQSARAGLGDGQTGIAHLEVITNDLLQRISIIRKHTILEFLFDFFGEAVYALLCVLERGSASLQV